MSFTVSNSQGSSSSVQVSQPRSAPPPPAPVAAAPAPVVETPAKVERVAPQLADIAQRAKATREAQRKIETDRAAFEAQKSGYISLEDLKKNPLQYMDKAGVTYDQLQSAAKVAVDPVQSKIQSLEQKIAEYENKFKSYDEVQSKASETQQAAAKKQIIFEASKLTAAPEYEVLKSFGQEGLQRVADKIVDHYNETEQLMDVEEAAKAVNAEFTEELKTRFGSLSLFKQLAAPAAEVPAPTAQATQQPKTTTLTNQMTPAPGRRLTDKERRDRAIRIMKGEAV